MRRRRAKCDVCGRRRALGELGLCDGCEQLVSLLHSYAAMVAILRLLRDPELMDRLEQRSKTLADALRTAAGDG